MDLLKYYLFLFLSFITATSGIAQDTTANNTTFELSIDSIECRITLDKWKDTSYYLHYTVKNKSQDTLVYITNSCFYYNHYNLTVEQLNFELNAKGGGGCYGNAITPHLLPPGQSFYEVEYIKNDKLNALKTGKSRVKLYVPLVKDDAFTYRVDGRDFIKTEEYLVYTGYTFVVERQVGKQMNHNNKGVK